MIYLLLILGIVLMVLGWRLIKKEKLENKELFQEVMVQEKNANPEYIKLQSLIYDLKDQISSIEEKLDGANALDKEKMKEESLEEIEVDEKLVSSDYNEKLNNIEKMVQENKTVEEMALDLNLGKGEVLLLKNLLKK